MSTSVELSVGGEKRERLTWIDSLKGFATLAVVLGHVTSEYFNIGEFENFRHIELLIRNAIYAFHMPLFIMISGFVFALAYVRGDGTIKRARVCTQLGNIAIVYVFWNSLSCIARIVFSGHVHNGASVKTLLMFPLKAIDPFWYLYVLILCYFVTMLFAKALAKRGPTFYILYAVSLVLCFARYYIPQQALGYTVTKFPLYFFFFILGFFFRQNEKALHVIAKPICIVLHFAVGITLWVVFVLGTDEELPWSKVKFFGVVMAYALSVAIFGLAKALSTLKKGGKGRFFSGIGRYSFEIYTIHCFLTTVIRMVLHKVAFIGFAANVCINFVVATAVPIAIALVLKKMRLHGLFFAPITWVKNAVEAKHCRAQ